MDLLMKALRASCSIQMSFPVPTFWAMLTIMSTTFGAVFWLAGAFRDRYDALAALAWPWIPLVVAALAALALRVAWRERGSRDAHRDDPVAMELEAVRSEAWLTVVGGAVIGSLTGLVLSLFRVRGEWAIFIGIIVFAVSILCAWTIFFGYAELFASNYGIVEHAAVFEDVEHDPFGLVSREDDLRTIFPSDRAMELWGSDMIRATRRGVPFELGDLTVNRAWASMMAGRSGQPVTTEEVRRLFSGWALCAHVPVPFACGVRVVGRGFRGADAPPFAWHGVRTELAGLDEGFRIVASDPLEAMKVLTPRRVEAIHRLWETAQAPLALLFRDSSLSVFLSGRRVFDVGWRRTLSESRDRLRRDVRMIADLLDAMCCDAQEASAWGAADRPRDGALRPARPGPPTRGSLHWSEELDRR